MLFEKGEPLECLGSGSPVQRVEKLVHGRVAPGCLVENDAIRMGHGQTIQDKGCIIKGRMCVHRG
jgi:hypothetical protein